MVHSYISRHHHHRVLTYLLLTLTTLSFVRTKSPQTNTEFIRSSCSVTAYPRLCFTSLSSHANLIQTSPKLMADAALNVSLSSAKYTSVMIVRLSRSPGLKPREASVIGDCIEELSDTVDELRRSIGEMSHLRGSNYEVYMSDIQTWVSAALTDENTCTDGFEGSDMNGKVKTFVRERILAIARLTSNALALINHFASLHG